MNYERQVDEIEDYLREREKPVDNFKIGVEFEHFIVYADSFESVTYYDENGTAETLKELERRGWTGDYEGEYILGAKKGNKVVTLEPGSQFEFSVVAQKEIPQLEKEYSEFIEEITEILDEKNQKLVAVGYHPKTKIKDIKLLPKKRYDYMFEYFKDKGSHAHNMMKGTAALQVSLDYKDEEDYRKKMRIANAMSPILYGICDNSYWFEGEPSSHYGLRTKVWTNMDNPRSGIVKGSLEDDFSYRKYGEYILDVEPIFTMRDGEAINTGNKKIKDLVDPEDYDIDELEHLMTMVFPDVRTKGFIEIRMMDSVPYPFSFSIISLIIGMFYSDKNVDRLYDMFKDINVEDVNLGKEEVIEKGPKAVFKGKSIIDWTKELVEVAKDGLKEGDIHYLKPLEDMLKEGKTPRIYIEERASEGRAEALKDCVMKKFEVK